MSDFYDSINHFITKWHWFRLRNWRMEYSPIVVATEAMWTDLTADTRRFGIWTSVGRSLPPLQVFSIRSILRRPPEIKRETLEPKEKYSAPECRSTWKALANSCAAWASPSAVVTAAFLICSAFSTRYLAFSASCCATCFNSTASVNSLPKDKWV